TNCQVWQLRSNILTRLPDTAVTGNGFSQMLPAKSLTLFVLPTLPPKLRITNRTNLWLDGNNGTPYIVQTSSNLMVWSNLSTNRPLTNSVWLGNGGTGRALYFRALWQP
ncbi:MAG TPA: hypothetical protein VF607_00050, partial [Verrucomicrobiae bacterium]